MSTPVHKNNTYNNYAHLFSSGKTEQRYLINYQLSNWRSIVKLINIQTYLTYTNHGKWTIL